MSYWLHDILRILVIAQADAAPDGGGAAGGGDGAAGGAEDPAGGGSIFDSWFFIPLMLILLMFYLMVVMPQRRKQKQMQQSLEGLKENDRVVTIGGIIGTIVSFSKDKNEVVIRVDEKTNTKMRMLRSAIRPLEEETAEAEADGDGKDLGKKA